jgi:hypothetical protein
MHPIELQKQPFANSLLQLGHVDHQTPKSKLNGPRVHFPYITRHPYTWANIHHAFALFLYKLANGTSTMWKNII